MALSHGNGTLRSSLPARFLTACILLPHSKIETYMALANSIHNSARCGDNQITVASLMGKVSLFVASLHHLDGAPDEGGNVPDKGQALADDRRRIFGCTSQG